jgi:hypothetical protein
MKMKNQQGRRGGAKASGKARAKARGKVGAKTSAALATAQLEPLGVPPTVGFGIVGCGMTAGYGLIAAGELETYKIGRATRITMSSIRAFIERRLAEAKAAKAGQVDLIAHAVGDGDLHPLAVALVHKAHSRREGGSRCPDRVAKTAASGGAP